jgi:hypothetical protein
MVESIFCCCAETAIVEKRTGNVSIINIFENINSKMFPAVHPKITVVNYLKRSKDDPANFEAEVQLSLDDKTLFTHPVLVKFDESLGHWAIFTFAGVQLDSPGTLTARFIYQERTIGSSSLNVRELHRTAL